MSQSLPIVAMYLPKFLLILLRASIFLGMLPFFGSKSFPAQFKIGLVVAISMVLTPVIDFAVADRSLPVLVLREIALGLALGLVVRMVFFAVDMAGQVMSNVMGLSIATVFNPEIGQSTEVARLYGIMAMLVLLAVDAHHDLLIVFVRSYELVPAGNVDVRDLVAAVVSGSGRIFIFALKMSAPVTVGMLVSSMLLGFISKAAPQVNIFFVSFPVYIIVGFLVAVASLPVFFHTLVGRFDEIGAEMERILARAGG